MMECNTVWEVCPIGWVKTTQTTPLPTTLAEIGQGAVMALLDTTRLTSMIRDHLVPKVKTTLCYTTIAGVHRQLHQWPVIQIILWYTNKAHNMELLKVDELQFPIVLGRVAPAFGSLVWTAVQHVAFTEDTREQPIAVPSKAGPDVNQTLWAIDLSFLQTQRVDDSLEPLQAAIVISEGVSVNPHRSSPPPPPCRVSSGEWWLPHQGGKSKNSWWCPTRTGNY